MRPTLIRHLIRPFALFVGLSSALAATGCQTLDDHPCPTDSTLTYESFGRGFVTRWCNQCHGGVNGTSSRAFTSVESIRVQRERIFINAAGENRAMPPGPDGPSSDERARLADWLACGAP